MMPFDRKSGTDTKPGLGIYLHIPFCVRKCNYCDFVSYPGCEHLYDDYVEALLAELVEMSEMRREGKGPWDYSFAEELKKAGVQLPAPVHPGNTIFIGGGTPSLLSAQQTGRIIDKAQALFGDAYEISMEANPGTFTTGKIREWKQAGITRLSLGVQSFEDRVLNTLGRIHDSEAAYKAAAAVKEAGDMDLNLDLMLGVPGLSQNSWESTLDKALSLDPDHLSFYSLQIEEGTPFYNSYKNGDMQLPSYSEDRRMYHSAVSLLKERGYSHYEVSNAAKPGKECRHNLKYWTMEEYIGLGAAAHSFTGGRRSYHTGDLAEYMQGPGRGLTYESSSVLGLKGDFFFTRLRLIDGFTPPEYTEIFGTDFSNDFSPAAAELSTKGYLKTGQRIALTEKGLDHTNSVMERLLEVL